MAREAQEMEKKLRSFNMCFALNILLYALLDLLEGREEEGLIKIKQLALTKIKICCTVFIDLN